MSTSNRRKKNRVNDELFKALTSASKVTTTTYLMLNGRAVHTLQERIDGREKMEAFERAVVNSTREECTSLVRLGAFKKLCRNLSCWRESQPQQAHSRNPLHRPIHAESVRTRMALFRVFKHLLEETRGFAAVAIHVAGYRFDILLTFCTPEINAAFATTPELLEQQANFVAIALELVNLSITQNDDTGLFSIRSSARKGAPKLISREVHCGRAASLLDRSDTPQVLAELLFFAMTSESFRRLASVKVDIYCHLVRILQKLDFIHNGQIAEDRRLKAFAAHLLQVTENNSSMSSLMAKFVSDCLKVVPETGPFAFDYMDDFARVPVGNPLSLSEMEPYNDRLAVHCAYFTALDLVEHDLIEILSQSCGGRIRIFDFDPVRKRFKFNRRRDTDALKFCVAAAPVGNSPLFVGLHGDGSNKSIRLFFATALTGEPRADAHLRQYFESIELMFKEAVETGTQHSFAAPPLPAVSQLPPIEVRGNEEQISALKALFHNAADKLRSAQPGLSRSLRKIMTSQAYIDRTTKLLSFWYRWRQFIELNSGVDAETGNLMPESLYLDVQSGPPMTEGYDYWKIETPEDAFCWLQIETSWFLLCPKECNHGISLEEAAEVLRNLGWFSSVQAMLQMKDMMPPRNYEQHSTGTDDACRIQ